MANQLKLALLGQPEFRRDEALLELTSVKGRALLAYLAITGQTHSRSALAGLLWGEMPEAAARTNLRTALSQLRKAAGEYLAITRRSAALNPESDIWLDVTQFEAAANRNDLQRAADLYRGDLLEDFYVPESLAFEEWLLAERERYRQMALEVLSRLADIALEENRLNEGIDTVRRLLAMEPWFETGHRQLMALLAADGRRSAALAQFETCRRLLAEELGVEPSAETVALYEAIRNEEQVRSVASRPTPVIPATVQPTPLAPPAPAPSLPPHNLRANSTDFVGRREEQAQIADLLAENECRLVTIIGPGGMGKTRLAQTIAADQLKPDTPFPNGVYFVPLASVNPAPGKNEPDTDPVLSAIGTALDLPFTGSAPLKSQLLNAVREKMMLLVLDNFEHLTDYADQVVDILAEAPGLKMMVTSRERLNLYEEWVFDLWGLTYPDEGSPTEPNAFDSIQLFIQRAKRIYHTFDLAMELPHVVRICRLLEGMPLGIELAASWVRILPCRDIARQIETNLDFLSTDIRNIPPRQRSLRAIFDYSWFLLSPSEQITFARLSVFRGGFTTAAAVEVAEAAPQILASLVDRSMLQRLNNERYGLHELLRQYGTDKLTDIELIRAKHARYFANLYWRQEAALVTGEATALETTITEIDNLRAAWQWAVDRVDSEVLDRLLGTIAIFYKLRGWFQEGQDHLLSALRALGPSNPLVGGIPNSSPSSGGSGEAAFLRGRLEMELARTNHYLGRYDEAKQYAETSIAIFEAIADPQQAARSRSLLGFILSSMGDNLLAKTYLEEAMATFEALNDLRGQADAFSYFGHVATGLGDLAEGLRCVEESLIRYRQLGDQRKVAEGLYYLGNYRIGFGDYTRALAYYEESKALHQELGNRVGIADCLRNEGLAATYLGRLTEAEQAAQASLALFTDFGDQFGIASNQLNLGRIALQRANYVEARSYLAKSLVTFQAMGNLLRTVLAQGYLGQVTLKLGDPTPAKHYFRQALEGGMSAKAVIHVLNVFSMMSDFLVDQDKMDLAVIMLAHTIYNPAVEAVTRRRAEQSLQSLVKALPATDLTQLTQQGKSKSLEEVVTMLLAFLGEG